MLIFSRHSYLSSSGKIIKSLFSFVPLSHQMKRYSIQAVIGVGILLLTGIIGIQYYWIHISNIQHKEEYRLQQKQDSINNKQFNDRVNISLKNVAQEITHLTNDTTDLYGAVQQLSSNYFTVNINDTLHPYYLQQLLIREFEKRNIKENFQYGIYDCFSDSIVYGNFIEFTKDSVFSSKVDSVEVAPPPIKWDHDGHYFSVIFPDRENKSIEPIQSINYWLYSGLIVFFVIIFFGFSILVILRQKRLSEIKNDFINNMTHELKTPISTISLSSSALLRGDMDDDIEKIHQYASIIYKENKRLEQQVEQVLSVAKLNRSKLKINKENVNLNELIQETCSHFELVIEQRNGSIDFEPSMSDDHVFVDPVHLSNAIFNIIDNAIKYCEVEPHVIISTQDQKRGVQISIQDNGIGMKKDAQKQIFEKFYRVPTGNVHDVKGFGLGLFYVRLIVEAHDGTVHVKSNPGKGSTFYIWIPKY